MSSTRHIKEEEKEDFEAIIAKNELTNPIIIEYLRKLYLAKKKVVEPTKVTTQEEVTKEEKKMRRVHQALRRCKKKTRKNLAYQTPRMKMLKAR
jgi:hypothetical protein